MGKKSSKKARKILSPEEKRVASLQKSIRTSIKNTFLRAGFKSFPVNGKEFSLEGKDRNEIDNCFIYENIIIIAEDTVKSTDHKDHIRVKKQTIDAIFSDKQNFLDFLFKISAGGFEKDRYPINRWKIYYLYFSYYDLELTDNDMNLYSPIKFIDLATLKYFETMSSNLKKSFRFELFKFLKIKKGDIGDNNANTNITNHEFNLLYPEGVTGITDGVQIVSFMMSAQQLIENGYVLRKDNWENSSFLYQRLITKKRINSIRNFVVNKKQTFFNNIIVSLPSETRIFDNNHDEIKDHSVDHFQNCTMQLPDEFNTIGIIDGQHRIFAYYENDVENADEIIVKRLRKKIHLLVTGLIFPEEWPMSKRIKFESEVFTEINKNSKNVETDVLLFIECAKNPFAKNSIARSILTNLNSTYVFKNKFQLSSVKTAQIKVASIIQYALAKLVDAKVEVNGLYKFWRNSKKDLSIPENLTEENDGEHILLNDYINYCCNALNLYFSAISSNYKEAWNDSKNYKILKTVSLNGFIIAFNSLINMSDGVKNFDFYNNLFKKVTIDFSNDGFRYGGSQYHLFAEKELIPQFEKHLENILQK